MDENVVEKMQGAGNRQVLDELLSQIRALRQAALTELIDVSEDEFDLPTGMERWSDVRRVLLRFDQHVREHANQIEGVRVDNERTVTMAQRMLSEGEKAWGKLLAATVGLRDEDIPIKPPDGGWSVQEVLEHILTAEERYLAAIRQARTGAPSPNDK